MTQIYIGGCSGSSSPEFARPEFGTLTTAIGIAFGDTGVFIDNGTGVSKVATFLLQSKVKEVYGLQTHFHSDHRQGIHNNRLLFVPKLVKTIYAPRLTRRSFKRLVEDDFRTETWPIAPNGLQVTEYRAGKNLSTPFTVKTIKQNHAQSGSAAYRVTTPEGDVVIATDGEHVGNHAKRLGKFISGCDVMYIDVQYRKGEYDGMLPICDGKPMSRVGWGHSTPEMLFSVLVSCPVPPKKIIVGHHDPSRTTGDLYVFEREIQNLLVGYRNEVFFAREGMTIDM